MSSEIPASVHGRSGRSRLDWPYTLAGIYKTKDEKKIFDAQFVFICSIEAQKSTYPTLCYFARVLAAQQPHVKGVSNNYVNKHSKDKKPLSL